MRKTCDSCVYCLANDEGVHQCFVKPPQAVLVTVQSFQGPQQTVGGIRPPVERSDFCGQYVPVVMDGE